MVGALMQGRFRPAGRHTVGRLGGAVAFAAWLVAAPIVPAAAQTMTADMVADYVGQLCSTIWRSGSADELNAYWAQMQQGPATLAGELRRRQGALAKAGAAREAMQATLKELRGQLALALNGQIAAAPVQQAVATVRQLTDDERTRLEQDLAQTTALRQDLERRRGGQGMPGSDERLLLQLEQDYLHHLSDPIPQLEAFGQGLRAIAGAAGNATVTTLEDSIAKATAAIAGQESEIALLTRGVSDARMGLNIARLTLKTVELNCLEPQRAALGAAGGGGDVTVPQGALTLLGSWSADCGGGYTSAGGFRMVIAADGAVSGRYTSDIGELPLSGLLDGSGALEGVAKHPDGQINWHGKLARDEALGTTAASGGLVFSGQDYRCDGGWQSQ